MDDRHFEDERFENLRLEGESFDDCSFTDCAFINCKFEDCALRDCSLLGCTFEGCAFVSLSIADSQMRYGEFRNCTAIGVHWADLLPSGRLAVPIRRMTDCLLKYNGFAGMNLEKVNFTGSNIQQSLFETCKLAEADFQGCKFEGTQISGCDLKKADFRRASGYQIDIASNALKGARFSFPEATRLLAALEIIIE